MANRHYVDMNTSYTRAAFIVWLCLYLTSASSPTRAAVYAWTGGSGRVVDAATGQPLANAAVLATWSMMAINGDQRGDVRIESTRTDADGAFSFPNWGPLDVRDPTGSVPVGLASESPFLHAFLPGYLVGTFSAVQGDYQREAVENRGPYIRKALFEGKTIRLIKFRTGIANEWFQARSQASRLLQEVENCGWMRFPHWVAALNAEAASLQKENPKYSAAQIWEPLKFDPTTCPHGREVYEESAKWYR